MGIVVALHSEASALTSALVPRETLVSLADGCGLWLSGMGPDAAQRAALALADAGALALATFGVAGALDAGLRSGTLICPQRVLDDKGHVYVTDRDWRDRLYQRLFSTSLASAFDLDLLSVSRPVFSVAEKIAVRERYQAAAVDMESAAVAQVAAERRLPFIALRAIVDERDDAIPEALQLAVDPWGRPRIPAMVAALCRHPPLLLRLPGLALRMDKALRALAAAASAAPGLQPAPTAHAVVRLS
ncbi:purine and other phosphorylase-like protein, family 1 [Pseudomonas sp. NA-150]|uniref:phosphorylase family protein n=1 Tax=Pseudomonas sp. NA-150 TaxID=3367525 RepID=UPI0037CC4C22